MTQLRDSVVISIHPNLFTPSLPTSSFGALGPDPASGTTSFPCPASQPLDTPLLAQPTPTPRSWTNYLDDWATAIQSVFRRIGDFITQATTLLKHLNPHSWWQPETFPTETRIHQLPGKLTPKQAAQELTPLAIGLSLQSQHLYQTLTQPIEKGLRRVLSQVNEGSPALAPNAPAAVMGLIGDQMVAKARFAQGLSDVAFSGERSLRGLDLSEVRTYHDVIHGLNQAAQTEPGVLFLSHADLNSNRHLSDGDRCKTLQLLCQLAEPRPTPKTSQLLANQGVTLSNSLVLLSLDNHPLEAPFNHLVSLAPPSSIPYWQQKLAHRATVETPYWQAFSGDWLAPLSAARPAGSRL